MLYKIEKMENCTIYHIFYSFPRWCSILCRKPKKQLQRKRLSWKLMRPHMHRPRQRRPRQRPLRPTITWPKARRTFRVTVTSCLSVRRRGTTTTTRRKCPSGAKDWSRWAKCIKDQQHHQLLHLAQVLRTKSEKWAR